MSKGKHEKNASLVNGTEGALEYLTAKDDR